MTQFPGERDRPYDTTEPEGLGSVISSLFALRGYGRVQANRQLHDLWRASVEPEMIGVTKVLSLRNGVLQVGVSNSGILNELESYRKAELLEKLQESEFGKRIKTLKFKFRGDLKAP